MPEKKENANAFKVKRAKWRKRMSKKKQHTKIITYKKQAQRTCIERPSSRQHKTCRGKNRADKIKACIRRWPRKLKVYIYYVLIMYFGRLCARRRPKLLLLFLLFLLLLMRLLPLQPSSSSSSLRPASLLQYTFAQNSYPAKQEKRKKNRGQSRYFFNHLLSSLKCEMCVWSIFFAPTFAHSLPNALVFFFISLFLPLCRLPIDNSCPLLLSLPPSPHCQVHK